MATLTEEASQLPVIRSVFTPQAVIEPVEAAYNLSVTGIQLVKALILDTYDVQTASGRYIFRIYPAQRRTRQEIIAELDFLEYVHARGASVSIPIRPLNGQRLLTLHAPEGPRHATLFTFAPGEFLDPEADLASVSAFGEELARVHAIADTQPHILPRRALDFDFLVEQPLMHLEAGFPHRAADWDYLREVAWTLKSRLDALPRTSSQFGWCHGDTSSRNVHVAGDGRVTLFDFDFCGPGWRAYDVATFLIDTSEPVRQAFLDGYQSIWALDHSELSSIPVFQAAQNIWVLGLRASYADERGTAFLPDRFIDHVLDFIRQKIEEIR